MKENRMIGTLDLRSRLAREADRKKSGRVCDLLREARNKIEELERELECVETASVKRTQIIDEAFARMRGKAEGA